MNKWQTFRGFAEFRVLRIGLKINVKKTNSLRLGISEGKKLTLGNEKIDQVGQLHLPWLYYQ